MSIPYKNDGLCWLWMPSCLTFTRLRDPIAVSLINAVHSAIGAPLVQLGDSNPYTDDLLDDVLGGGGWNRDVATKEIPGLGVINLAVAGPVLNTRYLNLDTIQLLVAVGGDVEGLKLWLEVDDLNLSIPGTNPRFDKEGGRMTWADLTWDFPVNVEWFASANNKWYRGTEMHQLQYDGQPLHLSEILELIAAGVSIISQEVKEARFSPV